MSKRLIITDTFSNGLEDLDHALVIIAKNIEDAFLMIDSVPGEDYTRKDLMEMALQYINKNPETKYALSTTR